MENLKFLIIEHEELMIYKNIQIYLRITSGKITYLFKVQYLLLCCYYCFKYNIESNITTLLYTKHILNYTIVYK